MKLEFSELKNKSVYDIQTGEKIGYVLDLNLDLQNGKILTILITPTKTHTLFFKNKIVTTTLIELSWNNIVLIGIDAIFVKIQK